MILDEEVFAVLLALVVVASVFASAQILRPEVVEPFTALGLLNEERKIGDYPKVAVLNDTLTLYVFVYNYMGRPVYYRVVYKVGTNETLPTNSTPSAEPTIMEWRGVLGHDQNTTFPVKVPVRYPEGREPERVALIFELWTYDVESGKWVYSGRWVHLYVEVKRP